MSSDPDSRKIVLRPSWKQYIAGYLLSILAIPLFGIGLVALYFIQKKHRRVYYEVSDTQISAIDIQYRRNIDLENIEEIVLHRTWWQRKLGIGTLTLRTSASQIKLVGVSRPERLRDTIEKAVAFHRDDGPERNFRKRPDHGFKPGSMEKMDYLTGLWQQGLLSDEDYENEKKHFE